MKKYELLVEITQNFAEMDVFNAKIANLLRFGEDTLFYTRNTKVDKLLAESGHKVQVKKLGEKDELKHAIVFVGNGDERPELDVKIVEYVV